MPRRLLPIVAALALMLGLTPAAQAELVLMSDNISVVGAVPDATIVSATFASDAPIMYTTTLTGFRTWDISDPRLPTPLGALPNAQFSNENLKLGEREDGTKLVLTGFDLVGYFPVGAPTNTRGTNRFAVIDVSDPLSPTLAATVNTNTRTHTMACVDAECSYAYTSGSGGRFDIYDLSDIYDPQHVNTIETPAGRNISGFNGVGHDWDIDEAGVAWWVGSGGVYAFDVSDPENPRIMNSSDHRARGAMWNRYISHNSQRPNATAFTNRPDDEVIEVVDEENMEAELGRTDLRPGELLYVTEEDLSDDPVCNNRGGFQVWHVQQLDADAYETEINPPTDEHWTGSPDTGTITPIGFWSTEMMDDPMAHSPAGAFCSAHYFDTHDTGIVAQAWYQQGLRILDPRDPYDIKQIGYFITGVQEIFGAVWVPEYDEDGQTGELTNLLYTEDPSRGVEILEVDLPEEGEETRAVTAPILPQWALGSPELIARANQTPFGTACLL